MKRIQAHAFVTLRSWT